uniref:hypothetical protein n=1 Tax=Streptobacillus canis TaxID=2678686 RepID=UPI0022AE8F97|nr:hypothetical protein [Streptobacillus canis]
MNQAIISNIIDEYYISIIPIILGNGIRLFTRNDIEHKLKLIKSTINNEIIELKYIPIKEYK